MSKQNRLGLRIPNMINSYFCFSSASISHTYVEVYARMCRLYLYLTNFFKIIVYCSKHTIYIGIRVHVYKYMMIIIIH